MVHRINFPPTARRFVAYLDIMGFKDFVYRHDHSEVAKVIDTVLACTDEIKRVEHDAFRRRKSGSRKAFDQGTVWPAVFSDSILLVSCGDSVADARKTIYATSFVLNRLLRAGVPLKGALAYGRFTADFARSAFFGRPLIESYLLAEEVLYYGAVLHDTFEEYLHRKKMHRPDILLKNMRVPIKGGLVDHSWVDWQFHLKAAKEETRSAEAVLRTFYRKVSGKARQYVDNSLAVYLGSSLSSERPTAK